MKRIIRMLKWVASEGRIPASIYETLRLIPGLKRGRTAARESDPVLPVAVDVVDVTLKYLSRTIADMVRLQLLLGCRPGEVCKLTPSMIDRDGEVWTARVGERKTAHHGHERNLFFGPKAQAIVAPYLLRSANDCLFRLCDTVKKRRAIASEARTTPMSCGNRPGSNRKSSPMRTAGTEYEPAAN